MTIVGVDEAGRGPLAGPVAVGAVAVEKGVPLRNIFRGLNDSKQLTEIAREKIFEKLLEKEKEGLITFQVTFRSAVLIDEQGIVPCVYDGVAECVQKLLPDAAGGKVYLDGSLKAPNEYEQETVIGGDALVPAIMLASVAAKVLRDRLMVQLAKRYPVYGFEQHKGYGTKLHQVALREYGPCEEHRQSYLRSFIETPVIG